MRTLYFDCFAGASGNMILGALIDAGLDRDRLLDEIKKLGLEGYEIDISKVDRSGISSTHVDVRVPHEHKHRHLHHIEKILEGSSLSKNVKDRAKNIFFRLAEAEAKVHGIDVAKVHFHEVGAMDAIIDVVGACIGFEILGIERFACSKIHVGSGFVEMEHGKFPVPPPAVAGLLAGVPIYSTDIDGELITPTGAAIISTVSSSCGAIPQLVVEAIGYGAGTRTYESFPNVLRIMIGEGIDEAMVDSLLQLETNIDDSSPQDLGYLMDKAFDIGVLDCWFTSIQMKKNRPAVKVSLLIMAEDRLKCLDLLYSETTTIGVRVIPVERHSLPREEYIVETKFGTVAVKTSSNGSKLTVMPEYDDLRRLAWEHNVPLREVRSSALKAFDAAKLDRT
ncbi:nickel pincer cofactor biosynthesis protein LarC [soil metagenome]